jgi:glutamyl-tRNA synthetase
MASHAWTREAIAALLKATAAKHGLKPPKVMMALRVLVAGTTQTPAIDAVLALLGRERARMRIERGLRAIG